VPSSGKKIQKSFEKGKSDRPPIKKGRSVNVFKKKEGALKFGSESPEGHLISHWCAKTLKCLEEMGPRNLNEKARRPSKERARDKHAA